MCQKALLIACRSIGEAYGTAGAFQELLETVPGLKATLDEKIQLDVDDDPNGENRKWAQVIPFFAFSPEVRKIIYTTNAIESLHSQVRKTIRNKGHFPSDDAAIKLIYLALRQIKAKWKQPPKEWHAAKSQLAIQFGERFTLEN